MAPVALGVLLVGVALFLAIFVARAGAVREAREEAIREASRGRIFGSPGGVMAAAGKFGQGRVEAGARGEGSSALLLELLLRIPGTACITGCSSRESRTLTVPRGCLREHCVFAGL